MRYTDLIRHKGLIDGAWCDADSGESFAVTDPATGTIGYVRIEFIRVVPE